MGVSVFDFELWRDNRPGRFASTGYLDAIDYKQLNVRCRSARSAFALTSRSTVHGFRFRLCNSFVINILHGYLLRTLRCRPFRRFLGSNLIFSAILVTACKQRRYILAKIVTLLSRIHRGLGRNTRRFAQPGPSA